MGDDAGTHGRDPAPLPDLGFFAGPASPSGISSFGSAPAQTPSSAPAPSRFSTPGVNQFGGPAVTPVRPAPRTAAEPDQPRLSGRHVAMFFGAVALVVIGVVVAVVMAARGKDVAERTTIAMPAQAGTFTKVGVESPDNPSAFLTGNAKLTDVQAGVYQRGAVQAAVVGARATQALTMPDQQQVMSAFSAAVEDRTGFPAVLAPVHTPLVGIFSCAQVEQESTVSTACLSTSPGAVVAIVIVGEDYQVATKDADALLKAVESQG
ncbi:MAG: hypothetical protein QOF58_8140 [Pseudonocardiales bacterium]|jgi:hypothetical protein|nr:hypothetical protein [Pseudonocardiales bacterium]